MYSRDDRPQRLNGSLDDVVRGLEIRLSDAEVDDVATGVLEGFGSGQDSKAVSVPNRFILSKRCIFILVAALVMANLRAVEIIWESAGLMVEIGAVERAKRSTDDGG
ncbi:MAG: hypothetical protein CM1200mP9_10840 [Gammaproteobacteria bacterium]|nr:MAG: hypothetical protein CM1200mP9_10840 [Gammaproteobacteria bacterium]